jgi:hypothetical protein
MPQIAKMPQIAIVDANGVRCRSEAQARAQSHAPEISIALVTCDRSWFVAVHAELGCQQRPATEAMIAFLV